MRDKILAFLCLVRDAKKIMAAEVSWETKHQLILSDEMSGRAEALFELEHHSKKSTCEESVRDWVNAADAKASELALVMLAVGAPPRTQSAP